MYDEGETSVTSYLEQCACNSARYDEVQKETNKERANKKTQKTGLLQLLLKTNQTSHVRA